MATEESSGRTLTGALRFGYSDVFTLLFVTLKLTRVIDWSWWYVLMPTLLPMALVLLCAILIKILSP